MKVELGVPPGVVSTTLIAPTAWAGAVTMTDVLVTVPKVPAVPSKVTLVVPVRFVPVMVTVAPVDGPLDGEIDVIVGIPKYVNVEVSEPPSVVNTTLTAPAACAGVTTVTEVAPTFVSDVPAVPPNVTLVVPVRFVPVIVNVVDPAIGPPDCEKAVIVGAAI